jgi:hypothetical protein
MRALKNGGAGGGGGGGGGVSSVAVSTANGFKGTVTNPTANATIAIKTSITGLLRGDGNAVSAASVVDADVNAAAAIAGTKISPNFGAQDIVTTGAVSASGVVATAVTLNPISTATRDAISSPPTGLVIYNSDTMQLEYYNGQSWTSSAPKTLGYSSTLSPNFNDGAYQVITCTGDLTIDDPIGGYDGARLRLRIVAAGGGNNLNFTSITIPSESSFSNPKALAAGKTYIALLENIAGTWCLESLIGGY